MKYSTQFVFCLLFVFCLSYFVTCSEVLPKRRSRC
ncbi:MAG: hypothetical protein IJ718_06210 [Paludibacteraceae bacterium]|nr:hypothetical protein [Paludibacteraceae bacterium]